MDILFTLGSFIVALAILIAVHEFGHFWVARRLGVKVLRFSIGFGRPLFRFQRHPDDTEYVVALVPLGGYVKMLDEREEDVPPDQAHLAFNRQALWKRSSIVAAGPAFNFLFAIIAYWAIFMSGDSGLRPVVGEVEPQSIAAEAGFEPGDELIRIGDREAGSWETSLFAFIGKSLGGKELGVRVRDASGNEIERWIPSAAVQSLSEEPDLLGRLGITPKRPILPAVIGELVPGEAAAVAGMQLGDRILAADGRPVESWPAWVDLVRDHADTPILIDVERSDGERLELQITPRTAQVDGATVGRIGAGVLVPDGLMDDYRVEVSYGPLESLERAVSKTVEMSVMTLRMVGRMIIGQASIENLSGPITIAETAGRTASYGLDSFLKFLAVVSISLGILNLLPIPVLDGGHLLYFFIEWIKGSPVSEEAQMQGQKIGLFLLAALMSLAFYLDLSRLLG